MAEIVLINPRFELSFWGMEHALPLLGKRANMPVAALPLLAALTPDEHRITLIDENVEDINFDVVAKADIVGLTGMSVQRFRMLEILRELKQRGVFTVVGGPWATVREDYFHGLVDVVFVGEAEQTWPLFLRDFEDRKWRKRYEQTERTDMTTVPTPRVDLLKMDQYLSGSVQFSRGCPFLCEFCDIIVTFGRKPRLKRSEQILRELDALRAQKVRRVFIVDDNLIGNKKAIKGLLRSVIEYQIEHGYPFVFFTEASLDLADDEELMRLMAEANITKVFVGIESPNEASLKETRKNQNVRGSMLEQVYRIQKAGMEVTCGMILGFDNDDAGIFDAHVEFIERARIPTAMVGMLHAVPGTPLYKRLANEGRLDEMDPPEFGTNVIPKQLTREELRDGYVRVMNQLYAPDAFFGRLRDLLIRGKLDFGRGQQDYWRKHPWRHLKIQAGNAFKTLLFYRHFLRLLPDRQLVEVYRQHFRELMIARPNPALWLYFIATCAMHYHAHTMSRGMALDQGAVQSSM